jgi:tellurite resistance protein TehA-like permease
LVCEWLWQSIPVLALVVALLVITSLVWVVRHVRRTEDLQTTVIAVLVGLFVTVSPAALLLVSR